MRFYKNAAGVVLMQYKYMESDRYWLPYNVDGIPVFSDSAPCTREEKLQAPPIKDPVPWPERPQVEKHILEQAKLSDKERVEWQQFFDSIPECADDIPDSKCFKWGVPELAAKFKAARSSHQQLSLSAGLDQRPDHMFEKVIWDKFTQQQWTQDNTERARRHEAEIHAEAEKERSISLQQQFDRQRDSSNNSTNEPNNPNNNTDLLSSSELRCDPDSDEETLLSHAQKNRKNLAASTSSSIPLGEAGVIDLGDIVLFSPDDASRKVDVANGYLLGVNVGKVVNTYPRRKMVELWWFWGTGWTTTAKWIQWRDPKTKNAYTENVDVESLLQCSDGMVAKLSFVPNGHERYCLTKSSVRVIEDVLATNDWE